MSEQEKKISLDAGDGIAVDNASWTFGDEVPKAFSEHVAKSVPFYNEGHDLVCRYSDFFVQENSNCYELGVSTGALLHKLAQRHSKKNAKWIGIDVEESMIKQAQVEVGSELPNVNLLVDDINLFPYEKSDLMISYYTIQFVPPYLRQELINKIYESLNWGGALVMFEKVRAADARFQDYASAIYTDYKLEVGYEPEEILAKSRSLKCVMEPFSSQGNRDLLKRAGFVDVMTIQKWVCFEGFIAIK